MLIQNFRQSLFRVDQVCEIDAHAIRAGKIAGIELMRRAASAGFACLRKRLVVLHTMLMPLHTTTIVLNRMYEHQHDVKNYQYRM